MWIWSGFCRARVVHAGLWGLCSSGNGYAVRAVGLTRLHRDLVCYDGEGCIQQRNCLTKVRRLATQIYRCSLQDAWCWCMTGAGFDDHLQPELPSFMFQNRYLLNLGPSATLDAPAGMLIDGSMHYPSSQLLLELARRENLRHGASVVDISWIPHDNPSNLAQMRKITAPLDVARKTNETESEFKFPSSMALGSLINHSYHLEERSCRFQCFLLSNEDYTDLIPSINASGIPPTPRVVVCVLATTCISTEEGKEMELFTDYGQDPLSLGIDPGYAGKQAFG